MKKRILFLIHDLGPGGAEKVLVNLVNALDRQKFDISLRVLFDWGPNRQFLNSDVHFSSWIPRNIPGNSHWMKLWTPEQLWKKIVPEKFDIVVSFLEGPCARIVGGCPQEETKIISWIHTPILTEAKFTEGFRNRSEAEECYSRADMLIFVSGDVKEAFFHQFKPQKPVQVLYNIFDSDKIRQLARLEPTGFIMDDSRMNWCGVGKLIPLKGWDRMLTVQKQLIEEGFPAHFWLIGEGPQRKELEQLAEQFGIKDTVTFAGYQTNPYSFISRCMLFVCASEREGFSTAVVESLLAGTPVCSTNVGGMRELLGANGEYGIVTEMDTLYPAVRRFFAQPEYLAHYRQKALERGSYFDKDRSVKAIEEMLLSL